MLITYTHICFFPPKIYGENTMSLSQPSLHTHSFSYEKYTCISRLVSGGHIVMVQENYILIKEEN